MPNSSIHHTSVETTEHEFKHVYHHPIVHTAQHIASPLSGALIIFFVHKRWQIPSLVASAHSRICLALHGEVSALRIGKSLGFWGGTAGVLWALKENAPPYLVVDEEHRKRLSKIYNLSTVPSIDESLSKWWTSAYINKAMDSMHSQFGLQWWQTIMAFTLALRICLVPFQVVLLRNSTRMKFILPEVDRLHAILRGGSTEARLQAAQMLEALFVANKCSPWKQCIFFPMVLPPAVLSLFTAVHNLCMTNSDMANEGTLWFPDLISRDDSYLLPILSGLSWLWMVEMGAGIHFRTYPAVRTTIRMIAAATVPLAATLPSGVFVFWITSNLFAITRGYVLRQDAVRLRLGIPLLKDVNALAHLPKYIGH